MKILDKCFYDNQSTTAKDLFLVLILFIVAMSSNIILFYFLFYILNLYIAGMFVAGIGVTAFLVTIILFLLIEKNRLFTIKRSIGWIFLNVFPFTGIILLIFLLLPDRYTVSQS